MITRIEAQFAIWDKCAPAFPVHQHGRRLPICLFVIINRIRVLLSGAECRMIKRMLYNIVRHVGYVRSNTDMTNYTQQESK